MNGALPLVGKTKIKRAISELVLEDVTRAELAVDVGEVWVGDSSAELSQLEIELLAGNAAGLFEIAHRLVPEGGLRLSRISKAARGYLLAEEERLNVPLAPRNKQAAFDLAQTAEQAARDVLRECLHQIAPNRLVVRQLQEAEGPHRLPGLRRLRSVCSVYAPVLQSPEMKRLNAEARSLGPGSRKPQGSRCGGERHGAAGS
ncbi:CHAD domain-containing protein [Mesorhizobium sp. AaZ16]|uniref:CHAD domain-containing protein n=1 Tax=Mesorhizobium sp. AaZ16 TaxID=3402289 RepID=UPI00374ED9D2